MLEFDMEEIGEALGKEPGEYTVYDFEVETSTHYGRQVRLDDKVLLFANPEDAAEYLGFDAGRCKLRPTPGTRKGAFPSPGAVPYHGRSGFADVFVHGTPVWGTGNPSRVPWDRRGWAFCRYCGSDM